MSSINPNRMILSYDKDIGRLYVPNSKIRIPNRKYPYLIKTNAQGFRSNYDFDKQNNSINQRIIFLGDSYTAGENINNDQRFSDLVQRNTNYECYNFGIAGTGVDQHLLIYEKIASDYDHDILVISPHLIDISRNILSLRIEKDRTTGEDILIPKPYFKKEKGKLNLYNYPVPKPIQINNSSQYVLKREKYNVNPRIFELFNRYTPLTIKKLILQYYKRPLYKGYSNHLTEEWIIMQALLERIIHKAKDKKVILMPLPETRVYLNPRYQTLFEKISKKYDHVLFVDVEKYFKRFSDKERDSFRFEYGHYSSRGHKIVAQILMEVLNPNKESRTKTLPRINSVVKKPLEDCNLRILGISAFYHDSAASLIIDGEIIAAAQEERFSRKKHDKSFPYAAINYCLEESFLDINDLDAIVFYDNSYLSLERIISSHLLVAPDGAEMWESMLEKWIFSNIRIQEIIKSELGYKGKIMHTQHHRSHAASAFFVSPFREAAILCIDAVGEWATASISYGVENKLKILKELQYPNSVGLLYSAFTYYTGFKVNSGEYKLMGLAPYGEPIYVEDIKKNVVDIKADGSIKLNLEYFNFMSNKTSMISKNFEELFGGPPRKRETSIRQRDMDIAKSIQVVIEEIMLKMAKHAKELTGCKYLCMAGGVALNCVGNGRLVREAGFEDIWVQPAAGDAGGSLGAALDIYYSYFNKKRKIDSEGRSLQFGSYWGPEFNRDQILAFLNTNGYKYQELLPEERSDLIADNLAKGKVVGHFSGRMEFGPRALGSRSILADPRDEKTQSVLNQKIKFRESFRPFAPTVLEENISEYFEIDRPSPYMLLVAPVKKDRCLMESKLEDINIIDLVNSKRSDIPAITHVDYSARIQSINKNDHKKYYELIESFKMKTGYGVVVNTSFNVRGEPIVCSPNDAYRCFMRTDMDILVLDNFLLIKEDQPVFIDKEKWEKEFRLD